MGILSCEEALKIGLESIRMRTDLPPKTKEEAIRKMETVMQKQPYKKWSEASVIAALQDFKKRNGYAPTVSNLTEDGMPKSATIQLLFHMRASAFLHRLFPETLLGKRHVQSKYSYQTPEEWMACFQEQFNKHLAEGMSCRRYNKLRDEKTPPWERIARACDLKQWSELMEKANVHYPRRPPKKETPLYINSVKSPYLEAMKQLNQEYTIVTAELRQLLERVG